MDYGYLVVPEVIFQVYLDAADIHLDLDFVEHNVLLGEIVVVVAVDDVVGVVVDTINPHCNCLKLHYFHSLYLLPHESEEQ